MSYVPIQLLTSTDKVLFEAFYDLDIIVVTPDMFGALSMVTRWNLSETGCVFFYGLHL